MTGPIHHGQGAASWPRFIPARGLWSRLAAPATQPLAGSGFVSHFCSPRSLGHPSPGVGDGSRVLGEGTAIYEQGSAARLGGGCGRAAGAEDLAAAGN